MLLRGLLLDFDGLICDTERAARRSWEELYGEFGLAFPPDVWARMAGRADGELVAVADLSRRRGILVDAAVRARRLRRKQALCDEEPLRPGVAELIAAAAQRGLTLAVVSSSPLGWVCGHLTRLGVRDSFAVLVTGDEPGRRKPAPDLYCLALLRTGLTAAEVIAFEDSQVGVQAATAAGLRCVAVPNAAASDADLQTAGLVLDSLASYVLDAGPLATEGTVSK